MARHAPCDSVTVCCDCSVLSGLLGLSPHYVQHTSHSETPVLGGLIWQVGTRSVSLALLLRSLGAGVL